MSLKKFSVLVLLVLSIAAVMPAAAAPSEAPVCVQYHTVQRGETFYRIARSYGLTMDQLQGINGLANINRIYAGQSLCVKMNDSSGTVYTVQAGDTLSKIARRFGINMSVLAQMNGITNVNRIYVGQVLVIPDVTIQ